MAKVRTAQGAQKFSQPIGSTITRKQAQRTALARLDTIAPRAAEKKFTSQDNVRSLSEARVRSIVAQADREHTPPHDNEPEPSRTGRAIARQIQGAAATAEPSITQAVVSNTLRNGGHMERLAFRLKTEKSFALKIDRNYAAALEEGKPTSKLEEAQKVKDLVRFTSIMDESNYWEGGNDLLKSLAAQGHTITKDKNDKNNWPERAYRGRNVQMQSPEGVDYEVQIHTAASLVAAERNHMLYNEARHQDTPPARRAELEKEMGDIFASVPLPPGTKLTASR